MDTLKTITTFPVAVEEIENAWITLRDGCRLAARIWLPENDAHLPVPAILEYLPYRKRDGTAARDALTHPYLAGHGYACVRVDMRGNGESDGLMMDEYLQQEQDDALEVIDWITSQPWCDGNVGMMGISWGGFNALQVAALQPEALKAIVTICSTDDRYADDIHYKGGALLLENAGWAATMFAYSSRSPDPVLVGNRWRTLWLQRLEHMPILLETWLDHPHRDAYWRHGSVCEDFAAIKAAVFAVGGWGDAYSNAIPRLLAGLPGPRLALTGPWVHKYPHFAVPQPAIGFLQECLRFWNHWLKGQPSGIMDEPMARTYVLDSAAPQANYAYREGQWVGHTQWPPQNVSLRTLHLGNGKLDEKPLESAHLTISSREDTGVACGEYCAMWAGPEWPSEQRFDDAASVCFESAVLDDDVCIFGAPVLTANVTCNKQTANLTARLCDVAPDGASTRITYGILNLSHRDSHASPDALIPGQHYTVNIKLDDIAYSVPKGHRLRLALSTAYWPLIWPSPQRAALQLATEHSYLQLPVANGDFAPVNAFAPPQAAPALETTVHRPASTERHIVYDVSEGCTRVLIRNDFGRRELSHGLITDEVTQETHSISPDDPNSARVDIVWHEGLGRNEWNVRTVGRTTLTSDSEYFYIKATLEAFEGDESVFDRTWQRKVARRLV